MLLIHSSPDRHLESFSLLNVMNNSVKTLQVQVSVCTSLGYIPTCQITASYCTSVCMFLKNCQIDFTRDCIFLLFIAKYHRGVFQFVCFFLKMME